MVTNGNDKLTETLTGRRTMIDESDKVYKDRLC